MSETIAEMEWRLRQQNARREVTPVTLDTAAGALLYDFDARNPLDYERTVVRPMVLPKPVIRPDEPQLAA
jgi:hypothetical protein